MNFFRTINWHVHCHCCWTALGLLVREVWTEDLFHAGDGFHPITIFTGCNCWTPTDADCGRTSNRVN